MKKPSEPACSSRWRGKRHGNFNPDPTSPARSFKTRGGNSITFMEQITGTQLDQPPQPKNQAPAEFPVAIHKKSCFFCTFCSLGRASLHRLQIVGALCNSSIRCAQWPAHASHRLQFLEEHLDRVCLLCAFEREPGTSNKRPAISVIRMKVDDFIVWASPVIDNVVDVYEYGFECLKYVSDVQSSNVRLGRGCSPSCIV